MAAACGAPEASGTDTAGETESASTQFTASSQQERLVVADLAAAAVHVYSVPDHELLGTLEGVAIADHAGFVQLEDGRLLVAGTEPAELLALDVTGQVPTIYDRVELPGAAVHIAVSTEEGLAAVSSAADPETGEGHLTIVDLTDFDALSSVAVQTEEPGIAFVDGALLHRDGAEQGRVDVLHLDDVLDGSAEPAATSTVGAYGHGEAVVDGHLLLATDDGLERYHVDADHVAAEGAVSWGAWGRGYYLRILGSASSSHVWSYVRDQSSDTWADWRNELYVLAPGHDVATRHPLGNGLAFRFAVSDQRVLFARMHPDGYVAHIVDADPSSPTFLQALQEVPLPTPTGAPTREADLEAVWESPGRPIAALTPAGDVGYVSRGGDGIIDVLDTVAGTLTSTIDVPTPLDGGGYLVVARPGIELVDQLGR